MTREFDKLKRIIKPFDESEQVSYYPEDNTQMVESTHDSKSLGDEENPIVIDIDKVKVKKPVADPNAIPEYQSEPISDKSEKLGFFKDPFSPSAKHLDAEYTFPARTVDPKRAALKNLGYQIGKLESSSGANVEHPIITDEKSMHYGDRGIGIHALMPKTIYDTIHRISKEDPAYDELRKLYKPKSDEYDYNYDQDDLRNYLEKHPEVYEKVYEDRLQKTKDIHHGDPAMSAVGWLVGTDAPTSKIKEILKSKSSRGMEARDRLKKFKDISDQMDPIVENENTPNLITDSIFPTDQKKIVDLMGMNYGPLQKLNPIQKGRFMELMKYLKK